jgi:hypothetical protein
MIPKAEVSIRASVHFRGYASEEAVPVLFLRIDIVAFVLKGFSEGFIRDAIRWFSIFHHVVRRCPVIRGAPSRMRNPSLGGDPPLRRHPVREVMRLPTFLLRGFRLLWHFPA